MDLGFTELLGGLLIAYVAYSLWAGLDPRYPLVAALVTLLGAFGVQAAGNTAIANDLALDTFLLFVAGLALLVLERVRRAGRDARSLPAVLEPPSDPASAR